jgi:hypothetical protein
MRQVRKERSLRTETGVPRPGAGFTSSYSYKPPARQQPDSPSSPLQRSVPARAADRRARRGQVIRSGAAVQRIQQQLRPYLSYPLCCLPATAAAAPRWSLNHQKARLALGRQFHGNCVPSRVPGCAGCAGLTESTRSPRTVTLGPPRQSVIGGVIDRSLVASLFSYRSLVASLSSWNRSRAREWERMLLFFF